MKRNKSNVLDFQAFIERRHPDLARDGKLREIITSMREIGERCEVRIARLDALLDDPRRD